MILLPPGSCCSEWVSTLIECDSEPLYGTVNTRNPFSPIALVKVSHHGNIKPNKTNLKRLERCQYQEQIIQLINGKKNGADTFQMKIYSKYIKNVQNHEGNRNQNHIEIPCHHSQHARIKKQ